MNNVQIKSTTSHALKSNPGSEPGAFNHPSPPVVLTLKSKRINLEVSLCTYNEKYYAGVSAIFNQPQGQKAGSINFTNVAAQGFEKPDAAVLDSLKKAADSISQREAIDEPSEILSGIDEAKKILSENVKDGGEKVLVTAQAPAQKKKVSKSQVAKALSAQVPGDEAQKPTTTKKTIRKAAGGGDSKT